MSAARCVSTSLPLTLHAFPIAPVITALMRNDNMKALRYSGRAYFVPDSVLAILYFWWNQASTKNPDVKALVYVNPSQGD